MPAWEAGEAASAGHHRGQAESIPLGKNGQCVVLGLPFLFPSLLGVSSPPQGLLFPLDLFPMVTDKAPVPNLLSAQLPWLGRSQSSVGKPLT